MTVQTPRPRQPLSRRRILLGAAALGLLTGCGYVRDATAAGTPDTIYEVTFTDEQWRQRLTPAAYDVLRGAGTETPYTSQLNDEHRAGTFGCAGCELDLFSSATKFDSGTGWPSFWQAMANAVVEKEDDSAFMTRTEVRCRRCGGHLGHVFDDGPQPTGLRYCMNGIAMSFRPT